jgi:hypothetical protein
MHIKEHIVSFWPVLVDRNYLCILSETIICYTNQETHDSELPFYTSDGVDAR